ncbi:hypothetical protein H0E87_005826 [Populus deltoides]|uniref:Uncharacterized protein n=1 Tax=Populus deltoides TaxID=3696 RepID=A0A8T2Z4X2_POPDE|nr:hypothetical protein H0E87_005826 [Populus deltoides]
MGGPRLSQNVASMASLLKRQRSKLDKRITKISELGEHELKGWQVFVHKEILLSASGAIVVNGDDFPVAVGNGTIFAGNPQVDLKTAIETAGDFTQISA